jgi:hypothetical protein
MAVALESDLSARWNSQVLRSQLNLVSENTFLWHKGAKGDNRMKKIRVSTAAGIVLVLAAIPVLAAISYFQGFEIDTFDWSGVTRVSSGTNGIPSAAGSFHAEADFAAAPDTSDAFTFFGGPESTFPAGGYTTKLDVYLDVEAGNPNDTRFDWSSAINDGAGDQRRDFVFNAGFYDDTDFTGSGPRFVISASNNATRFDSFPKDPERDPFTITETGWYTFTHRFYNAGLGILAVELRITTLSGALQHSWTLSNPTDVIGSTVGGHSYGWLVIQEFPVLAIDNATLVGVNVPTSANDCKNQGWRQRTRADGTPFANQGDCIQYVHTGR